jgi:O-antigen ligase
MTHAHNIYFQNLFQGGLVRFIAWIIFFLTLLFNLLKFRSTWSIPFLSGFLALSLEGFFENWWGDSEVLTLFFLMMLIFNNRAKSACLKS